MGWHERAGEPHAEVNALSEAGPRARGATVYVTLEPCCHQGRTPPCTETLIRAGISRVVAAMADPNPRMDGGGLGRLREAGITVESGLLEAKARSLNPGFVSLMTKGRPWVRLKSATSLDGRTAMASGESQWVTGGAARRDVQRLRAQSSAVVTGIGTVLADDPSLNVRLDASELGVTGAVRQPVRVILDSRLRIPATARILAIPGPRLVVTRRKSVASEILERAGVDVVAVGEKAGRLDLGAVVTELARRELGEVHLECGGVLAGAFLAARLVDEIVVYFAPHIMGDAARGMAHLPELKTMRDRIPLQWRNVKRIGDDLRVTLQVVED